MNKMKRIAGLFLAIIMVLGTIPVYATNTEYTGVELRIQQVSPEMTPSDVEVSLKAATDEAGSMYSTPKSLTMSGKWYHAVYLDSDIPKDDSASYTAIQSGVLTLYVKPMSDTEYFDITKDYLYVAEVATTGNAILAEDCIFTPGDNNLNNLTSTSATISVEINPVDDVASIQYIHFTCDEQGNINIKNRNDEWKYVYYTRDGSFDLSVTQGNVGKTIGVASINNAQYSEVASPITFTSGPQIIVAAVSELEWNHYETSAIYAYGIYTVPMGTPYIQVENLVFGKEPSITELGTVYNGKYSWDIAQASFIGWYLDKEGTIPATTEQNAYAIFNLRSYGLFKDDITASDFTLRTASSVHVGAHLLPKTESNAYKVAFLIPSDKISVSLQVIGEGANMFFLNEDFRENTTISLSPYRDGSYPWISVGFHVEPGYYIKSATINGQPYEGDSAGVSQNSSVVISNTTGHEGGLYDIEVTENTLITIETAPADIIVFDYGDLRPAYSGNEELWHDDNKYYVSGAQNTQLCGVNTFNQAPLYKTIMLNTKPDGSGIGIPATIYNSHFFWSPIEANRNDTVEIITLYVITECYTHLPIGVENSTWVQYDEKAPTCVEEGHKAYRRCTVCNIHEALDENGYYQFIAPPDLLLPITSHNHSIYTDNGDGTHTVKCATCDDFIIENHTFENGQCVCSKYDYIVGDIDGDGVISDADAIYLLYHTIFPEDYLVNQPADFDKDGAISDADAIYLLYHTIFPEDYPLTE